MKKILILIAIIFLNNCTGYSPIFSSKQTNFYISEIIINEDNKSIRQIVKNLKPYTENNNKKKIILELDLSITETVSLRDAKGNVATQEMKMILDAKGTLPDGDTKKIQIVEKFTFNNQSNKFELNQYKKSIQSNLIDKIYEKLILELRIL